MPTSSPKPDQQRKRRRRLLRTLLLKFLRRLKKACEVLETPAQWYDVTKELRGMLNDYRDVLPSGDRDTLWLATLLTDQTQTGITQACTILQSKLVSVISALPSGGLAAPILIGGALLVAAVAAVVAIGLNLAAITLTIQNVNCEPIVIAAAVPVSLPGLDLPGLVSTGETATAQLPPVPLTTNFRAPRTLLVNLLGAPLTFQLPARVVSAFFDNIDLMVGTHTFDLGRQKQHSLVVHCGSK